MARSPVRARRIVLSAALVFSWVVIGAQPRSALADVMAVTGRAFGYFADNIVLFNSAQPDTGPLPSVTVPPGGSAAPLTANAATGLVQYGPATLFSSGALNVLSHGTVGVAGTVTSSATITNVNTSGSEVFTASSAASTCTASEAGTTGTTTITGGTIQTSDGNPVVDGDEVTVAVPSNPAPNTEFTGTVVGDAFRYVFNEQVTASDGTLTVNAAHLYLLGPTAVGDLFIGQSRCDVAATAATTTTSTTAATTTTTTARATTTTMAATTTTTGGGVAGGAFGFFTNLALFGGGAAPRGPTPTVTLPAGGSATPVTATAATGDARYGPAVVFSSGALTVNTQGTPGGTVTGSAKIASVNTSQQEVFTAADVASTCTASRTGGAAGSTTITGGRLQTSEGSPTAGDERVVTIPASPAVNQSFDGTIEGVGDRFRYVFNEQIRQGDGSIVVNAAHQYLLGPTAVGEVIIGQVRCAATNAAFTSAAGSTGTGTGTGSSSGLASTGRRLALRAVSGLVLLSGGLAALLLARRRQVSGAASSSGGPSLLRRLGRRRRP